VKYGRHKAVVDSAIIEVLEDGREVGKVGFVVTNDAGDEEGIEATVWLTEKALGIAYARFRSIGFDIKTRDLNELNKNPFLLKGNTCEIEVGEYNDRPQVTWFGQPKTKAKPSILTSLTKKIRSAVGDGKVSAPEEGPPAATEPEEHPADVENKHPRF
jgi:hypothetical protein